MTSSKGNIFCDTGPLWGGIHRSPVNSPHKCQWRGPLTFSLIYTWTNSWTNNTEAGDLRHHRAHYDVTVMSPCNDHQVAYPFANNIADIWMIFVQQISSILVTLQNIYMTAHGCSKVVHAVTNRTSSWIFISVLLTANMWLVSIIKWMISILK